MLTNNLKDKHSTRLLCTVSLFIKNEFGNRIRVTDILDTGSSLLILRLQILLNLKKNELMLQYQELIINNTS